MYYYIINPSAGKGAINTIQDKLRDRLRELGIAGEFAKTTGPGEASKMATAAIEKGYNTVVAVGGDGTVNEVINGITKDNVAVGIIPIGNSNVLANHLGIHNWQQAAAVLAARRLTSYGLIAAGSNFFLSTLTLGFETDLEKRVDTVPEAKLSDKLRHFGRGYNQAQNFTPLKCLISVDDKYELECDLFTLTVANQKFLNPLADNRLIVSISDKPSKTQTASYMWRRLQGKQPTDDGATTRFLASRVIIRTEPPTGIMVDGKLTTRTPIAIRLTDRHIRFITEKPQEGLQG
ncbi:MAG TPA: diacylglycerol kinase family protein [Candidatus Nanoarchaeia archaeon]|nr:diacylglycerol kinase family protein [Candidatus Nanoarchaeia archaeon]